MFQFQGHNSIGLERHTFDFHGGLILNTDHFRYFYTAICATPQTMKRQNMAENPPMVKRKKNMVSKIICLCGHFVYSQDRFKQNWLLLFLLLQHFLWKGNLYVVLCGVFLVKITAPIGPADVVFLKYKYFIWLIKSHY